MWIFIDFFFVSIFIDDIPITILSHGFLKRITFNIFSLASIFSFIFPLTVIYANKTILSRKTEVKNFNEKIDKNILESIKTMGLKRKEARYSLAGKVGNLD